MKTFDLILSSPDGDLFHGEAQALIVRGTEGELAILADHIPFITAVVPCDAKLVLPDDSEKLAALDRVAKQCDPAVLRRDVERIT